MRKRLRKKRRLAEFQELEIPLELRLDEKLGEAGIDDFLHDLSGMLESRGLVLMGSGDVEWFGAVARLERGSVTDQDEALVRELLRADARVKHAVVGPRRDAWHGDFQAA